MKAKRELRSSAHTYTPNTDASAILASSKLATSCPDDTETTQKSKARGRPKKMEAQADFGKVSEFCLQSPLKPQCEATPIAAKKENPEEPSLKGTRACSKRANRGVNPKYDSETYLRL
jgi:hypothetical protein